MVYFLLDASIYIAIFPWPIYTVFFPYLASNILGTEELFWEVKQLAPKTEDLFVSICTV
jgi:hypothetical protein